MGSVCGCWNRLHVSTLRHGDDQLVVCYEIFEAQVAFVRDDSAQAGVGEALPYVGQLVFDDGPPPLGVGHDALEFCDQVSKLGEFGAEFVDFQGGETPERHVEDGIRLDFAELEGVHQIRASIRGICGAADDLYDLVDVVDGNDQTLEDVSPRLGLVETELCSPLDHFHLVVEVVADHVGEVQRPGHPVDQRDHVVAEGVLERRVLVELVEHHLGNGVPLQLDHEPGPDPVGRLVSHVGDSGELLRLDLVLDLGHDPLEGHLIGKLGDDDGGAPLANLLDVADGPDLHGSATGGQGFFDTRCSDQEAAGGEIWALDELEQLLGGGVGVVDDVDGGVDHLAEVVGRDVGGHPDGDAL